MKHSLLRLFSKIHVLLTGSGTGSPPFRSQSNGQAEIVVDTFKPAMIKAKDEGPTEEIIDRFLLAYQSNPNSNVVENKSLAEIMFGRPLRSVLDLMLHKKTTRTEQQDRVSIKRETRYMGDQLPAWTTCSSLGISQSLTSVKW